jgi:hypothetical protein
MFHKPLTRFRSLSSWSGIAMLEDMQHSAWARPLSRERSYNLWDLRSRRWTRFYH